MEFRNLKTRITQKGFEKRYNDHASFVKALKKAQAFADLGISPKVVDTINNTIVFEKIVPLNCSVQLTDPSSILKYKTSLSISHELLKPLNEATQAEVDCLRNKIIRAIDIMHTAGWAHGDLHIENIGLDTAGNVKIFDTDTAFRIDEGRTKELDDWIKRGFGNKFTFGEFVQYDYTNWQTEWLKPSQ